jgi:hypothetical protein
VNRAQTLTVRGVGQALERLEGYIFFVLSIATRLLMITFFLLRFSASEIWVSSGKSGQR